MVRYKEIAKDANVSIATVSRVINNQGYVSEKSKKKVKESLEKLTINHCHIFRITKRRGSRKSFFLSRIC